MGFLSLFGKFYPSDLYKEIWDKMSENHTRKVALEEVCALRSWWAHMGRVRRGRTWIFRKYNKIFVDLESGRFFVQKTWFFSNTGFCCFFDGNMKNALTFVFFGLEQKWKNEKVGNFFVVAMQRPSICCASCLQAKTTIKSKSSIEIINQSMPHIYPFLPYRM